MSIQTHLQELVDGGVHSTVIGPQDALDHLVVHARKHGLEVVHGLVELQASDVLQRNACRYTNVNRLPWVLIRNELHYRKYETRAHLSRRLAVIELGSSVAVSPRAVTAIAAGAAPKQAGHHLRLGRQPPTLTVTTPL